MTSDELDELHALKLLVEDLRDRDSKRDDTTKLLIGTFGTALLGGLIWVGAINADVNNLRQDIQASQQVLERLSRVEAILERVERIAERQSSNLNLVEPNL